MALLRPPKENTPPRRDPVESPPPMIESSLYSIVSDYEDREYFICMMMTYFENNRADITIYRFTFDRTTLYTIFMLELSLILWLLEKAVGI
ncbi:hypothetical protein L3X38_023973 [Prunus dulcis]|uniref:Uncharacterized protein n=1 Tax=Prunus dulcis TaxID=3755 RepID=A0AAD4W1H7_PRUDU|nr:hypothetical protein L3X38_023973 [Prunus dulcis]